MLHSVLIALVNTPQFTIAQCCERFPLIFPVACVTSWYVAAFLDFRLDFRFLIFSQMHIYESWSYVCAFDIKYLDTIIWTKGVHRLRIFDFTPYCIPCISPAFSQAETIDSGSYQKGLYHTRIFRRLQRTYLHALSLAHRV